MRISEYKCTNKECNNVFDYCKEDDLAGFPSTIPCEICKSDSKRIWAIGDIDIAQGKLGRASNGYSTGSVSHCSEYGRFKGTKITQEKA